jgi:hypothetical protein
MAAFQKPELDIPALRQALDEERRARGLSWQLVGKHLGIPTVRDMGGAGHIQGDAVVLILQWLRRRCDDFVVRREGRAAPWAHQDDLPGPPPLFARFDTILLYAAMNRVREARKLTWPEVAAEVGTNSGVIARFQKGGRINGQLMVVAAEWAGEPVEALLQPSQPFLGPARMDAGGAHRKRQT